MNIIKIIKLYQPIKITDLPHVGYIVAEVKQKCHYEN